MSCPPEGRSVLLQPAEERRPGDQEHGGLESCPLEEEDLVEEGFQRGELGMEAGREMDSGRVQAL